MQVNLTKSMTEECKNISLKDAEEAFNDLNLHSSVLNIFPTLIKVLSEQLNEDDLYNALHDVEYIQKLVLKEMHFKMELLKSILFILQGKSIFNKGEGE